MGRLRIIAGVAGALLLVSGGATAAAAITSGTTSSNVINGCVNNKTDVLTVLLKSSASCPKGTTKVSWNKTGPAGPAGTTGIFGTNTNKASISTGGGGDVQYVGQVLLMAGGTAPAGTLPCDGQVLPISSYAVLFDLLGKRYGGNGTTTFGLPNLTKAAPNGLTYVIADTGIFP
jgi:hypothetical protein